MQDLKCFLKLKSVLSLIFSFTTCYLAVKGQIHMETFMATTTAIITYYFTRKDDKSE